MLLLLCTVPTRLQVSTSSPRLSPSPIREVGLIQDLPQKHDGLTTVVKKAVLAAIPLPVMHEALLEIVICRRCVSLPMK